MILLLLVLLLYPSHRDMTSERFGKFPEVDQLMVEKEHRTKSMLFVLNIQSV